MVDIVYLNTSGGNRLPHNDVIAEYAIYKDSIAAAPTAAGSNPDTTDNVTDYVDNNTSELVTSSLFVSLNYSAPTMILVASLLTIVIIATVFGNLLVGISLFRFRSLRTVSNFLIGNLALSDFLLATAVLPLSSANECLGHWVFGRVACNVWLLVDVLCCTASLWNICIIALDRYTATLYPIWYRERRSSQQALLYVALVWTVSSAVCVPPLLGWNDLTGNYVRDNVTNVYHCILFQSPSYVLYSASGSFFVPFFLTVFLYVQIFVVLRERMRKMRGGGGGASGSFAAGGGSVRVAGERRSDAGGGGLRGGGGSVAGAQQRSRGVTTLSLPRGVGRFEEESSALIPSDPITAVETGSGQQQRQSQSTEPPVEMTSLPGRKSNDLASLCSDDVEDGSVRRVQQQQQPQTSVSVNETPPPVSATVPNGQTNGRSSRFFRIFASASTRFRKHDVTEMQSNCTNNGGTSSLPPPTVNSANRRRNRRVDEQPETELNRDEDDLRTALMSNSELESVVRSGVARTPEVAAAIAFGGARRRRRRFGDVFRSSTSSAVAAAGDRFATVRSNAARRFEQREIQATIRMSIIIAFFCGMWLGFFTVYVINSWCGVCNVPRALDAFFFWLGYSNSSINPILYTIFNDDFRRAFRKLIGCGGNGSADGPGSRSQSGSRLGSRSINRHGGRETSIATRIDRR